jgi:hypothetical protein
MLKKVLVSLFLGVACVAVADSKTENCATLSGPQTLENKSYTCLKVEGMLTFKNLSVKDLFAVDGSAQGENLNCGLFEANGSFMVKALHSQAGKISGAFVAESLFIGKSPMLDSSAPYEGLKVEGACTLTNARIQESLTVEGALVAQNLKVKGLTKVAGSISADGSTFSTMEIEGDEATLENCTVDVVIFKKPLNDKKQTLILKGKTKVLDKVVFESNKGKVEKDKDVIVNKTEGAL